MDHGYFKDRLSAYIDQELTPEETRAVADHLEECAECRQELTRLGELERLVGEHSGLDGEEYFEQSARKIEERLGLVDTTVTDISPASEKRFKGLWWKVTSIAASVAILTFVGLHKDEIFESGDITAPGETRYDIRVPEDSADGDTAAPVRDSAESEPPSTGVGGDEGTAEFSGQIEDRQVPEPVESEESLDIPIEPSPAIDRAPSLPEPTAPKQMLEQEVSAPQTSSTERPSRGTTGAALTEEDTPPETTPDVNYKQKIRDQFVSPETSKSIKVEGTPDESVVDIAGDDYQPPPDLSYWISRRDSLNEQLTKVRTVGRSKRVSRPQALNSLVPSSPPEDSTQVKDSLEADLVESWFWIASLSTDSTQVKESRGKLEGVASDTTSVNSGLASDYLRRLGNK